MCSKNFKIDLIKWLVVNPILIIIVATKLVVFNLYEVFLELIYYFWIVIWIGVTLMFNDYNQELWEEEWLVYANRVWP